MPGLLAPLSQLGISKHDGGPYLFALIGDIRYGAYEQPGRAVYAAIQLTRHLLGLAFHHFGEPDVYNVASLNWPSFAVVPGNGFHGCCH